MAALRSGLKNIYSDTKSNILFCKVYSVTIFKEGYRLQVYKKVFFPNATITNVCISTATKQPSHRSTNTTNICDYNRSKPRTSYKNYIFDLTIKHAARKLEDWIFSTIKSDKLKTQIVTSNMKSTQVRLKDHVNYLSTVSNLKNIKNLDTHITKICPHKKASKTKFWSRQNKVLCIVLKKSVHIFANAYCNKGYNKFNLQRSTSSTYSQEKLLNLNNMKRIGPISTFKEVHIGSERTTHLYWDTQKRFYHKTIIDPLKDIESNDSKKKEDNEKISNEKVKGKHKSKESISLMRSDSSTDKTIELKSQSSNSNSKKSTSNETKEDRIPFDLTYSINKQLKKLSRCQSENIFRFHDTRLYSKHYTSNHILPTSSRFLIGSDLRKKNKLNSNLLNSSSSTCNKNTFNKYSTGNINEKNADLGRSKSTDNMALKEFLIDDLEEPNSNNNTGSLLRNIRSDLKGLMLNDYLDLGIKNCVDLENAQETKNDKLGPNKLIYNVISESTNIKSTRRIEDEENVKAYHTNINRTEIEENERMVLLKESSNKFFLLLNDMLMSKANYSIALSKTKKLTNEDNSLDNRKYIDSVINSSRCHIEGPQKTDAIISNSINEVSNNGKVEKEIKPCMPLINTEIKNSTELNKCKATSEKYTDKEAEKVLDNDINKLNIFKRVNRSYSTMKAMELNSNDNKQEIKLIQQAGERGGVNVTKNTKHYALNSISSSNLLKMPSEIIELCKFDRKSFQEHVAVRPHEKRKVYSNNQLNVTNDFIRKRTLPEKNMKLQFSNSLEQNTTKSYLKNVSENKNEYRESGQTCSHTIGENVTKDVNNEPQNRLEFMKQLNNTHTLEELYVNKSSIFYKGDEEKNDFYTPEVNNLEEKHDSEPINWLKDPINLKHFVGKIEHMKINQLKKPINENPLDFLKYMNLETNYSNPKSSFDVIEATKSTNGNKVLMKKKLTEMEDKTVNREHVKASIKPTELKDFGNKQKLESKERKQISYYEIKKAALRQATMKDDFAFPISRNNNNVDYTNNRYYYKNYNSNKKKLDDLKMKLEIHKNKQNGTKYSAGVINKDKLHYDFSIKIEPDDKHKESAMKIKMSKISNNVKEEFGDRKYLLENKAQKKFFANFHNGVKEANTRLYETNRPPIGIHGKRIANGNKWKQSNETLDAKPKPVNTSSGLTKFKKNFDKIQMREHLSENHNKFENVSTAHVVIDPELNHIDSSQNGWHESRISNNNQPRGSSVKSEPLTHQINAFQQSITSKPSLNKKPLLDTKQPMRSESATFVSSAKREIPLNNSKSELILYENKAHLINQSKYALNLMKYFSLLKQVVNEFFNSNNFINSIFGFGDKMDIHVQSPIGKDNLKVCPENKCIKSKSIGKISISTSRLHDVKSLPVNDNLEGHSENKSLENVTTQSKIDISQDHETNNIKKSSVYLQKEVDNLSYISKSRLQNNVKSKWQITNFNSNNDTNNETSIRSRNIIKLKNFSTQNIQHMTTSSSLDYFLKKQVRFENAVGNKNRKIEENLLTNDGTNKTFETINNHGAVSRKEMSSGMLRFYGGITNEKSKFMIKENVLFNSKLTQYAGENRLREHFSRKNNFNLKNNRSTPNELNSLRNNLKSDFLGYMTKDRPRNDLMLKTSIKGFLQADKKSPDSAVIIQTKDSVNFADSTGSKNEKDGSSNVKESKTDGNRNSTIISDNENLLTKEI